MEPFFDHERLDVYQSAREFNREVKILVDRMARGHSDSKENLLRAAKSVTRNLAEGAGKWRIADKTNFYHIARASATECAASLDELVDFALVPADRITRPKQVLARVVAMLIAMIRSLDLRDGETMQKR